MDAKRVRALRALIFLRPAVTVAGVTRGQNKRGNRQAKERYGRWWFRSPPGLVGAGGGGVLLRRATSGSGTAQ